MNVNILNNVCQAILKRLQNQQSVREEQVHLLMEEIGKRIEQADFKHFPDAYHQLQHYLQRNLQYGRTEALSSDDAVTFGALWAICSLAEATVKRHGEDHLLSEAAQLYKKHLSFFRIMQKNPGIKHGDLAKQCNKSPSELSQLVARLQWERYFSFSKAGREKYYYLEKRGEDLLNEMEKKASTDYTNLYFNMKHEKWHINLKMEEESLCETDSRKLKVMA
ncbi:MAG: hypothetical protein SCM11_04460 [Bacillota bacterium]|nr:hypothetical protein [Bacillota bacterium]